MNFFLACLLGFGLGIIGSALESKPDSANDGMSIKEGEK